MKINNKAFTLIELCILLFIIAIVVAIVGASFVNIYKLLFWVLVYCSIPASIFGVFLKLNQKYKWVVKKRYGNGYNGCFDYKLKNGGILDKDIVKINMIAFVIIWPIYLPGIVAFVGGKKVYHRYFKNNFSIPEDK